MILEYYSTRYTGFLPRSLGLGALGSGLDWFEEVGFNRRRRRDAFFKNLGTIMLVLARDWLKRQGV